VYGVALQSAGREREALNVLRSAQKRHPNDREILWALVTYLVQSGSPQEALGYAEKLRELFPQDSQIQNLIRTLDPDR
jgi:Flp pilus assembly protein TadD